MKVLKLTDLYSGDAIFINFEKVIFFEKKERGEIPYTYIQFDSRGVKVKEDLDTIQRMMGA